MHTCVEEGGGGWSGGGQVDEGRGRVEMVGGKQPIASSIPMILKHLRFCVRTSVCKLANDEVVS